MEKYKRNDVVVLLSEIMIRKEAEKGIIQVGSILRVWDFISPVAWFIRRKDIEHELFCNSERIRHATPAEKFIYEKHIKKTGDPIMSPQKPQSHESEK